STSTAWRPSRRTRRGRIRRDGPNLLSPSLLAAADPAGGGGAGLDDGQSGILRLSLPAAQRRQRPWLGDPVAVRLPRALERVDGPGGGGDRGAGGYTAGAAPGGAV